MVALNKAVKLDKGLEGWIWKFSLQNFWRVASWYELDDLVQDGYLCYAVCLKKYKHTVYDKPNFMALFKRAFYNHVIDLANSRTRAVPQVCESHIDYARDTNGHSIPHRTELMSQLGTFEYPTAEFLILLKQAPPLVKRVIALYYTEAGLELLHANPLRMQEGVLETTHQWLCRCLCLDPQKAPDLPLLVRNYFSHTTAQYA